MRNINGGMTPAPSGGVPRSNEYEALLNEQEDDSDEEDSDGNEYECQTCDRQQYIDDYQKHADAWCDSNECGTIRSFKRIQT